MDRGPGGGGVGGPSLWRPARPTPSAGHTAEAGRFSASDRAGGAIACDGSTLSVTSSSLTNSVADSGGGLAVYDCTVTLTDTTNSGNGASYGGGIHSFGGTVAISAGSVRDNMGVEVGGGVAAEGVDSPFSLTMAETLVQGNHAGSGGALALIADATARCEGLGALIANGADSTGGAVLINSDGAGAPAFTSDGAQGHPVRPPLAQAAARRAGMVGRKGGDLRSRVLGTELRDTCHCSDRHTHPPPTTDSRMSRVVHRLESVSRPPWCRGAARRAPRVEGGSAVRGAAPPAPGVRGDCGGRRPGDDPRGASPRRCADPHQSAVRLHTWCLLPAWGGVRGATMPSHDGCTRAGDKRLFHVRFAVRAGPWG